VTVKTVVGSPSLKTRLPLCHNEVAIMKRISRFLFCCLTIVVQVAFAGENKHDGNKAVRQQVADGGVQVQHHSTLEIPRSQFECFLSTAGKLSVAKQQVGTLKSDDEATFTAVLASSSENPLTIVKGLQIELKQGRMVPAKRRHTETIKVAADDLHSSCQTWRSSRRTPLGLAVALPAAVSLLLHPTALGDSTGRPA
jgi:hypothetical protein